MCTPGAISTVLGVEASAVYAAMSAMRSPRRRADFYVLQGIIPEDATDRWASRCSSAGLGYLLEARSQAVHRAPSPQGQDGETDPSHDGQDHGGAIDAYLQRTEPLFERSFAAAPRCPCPGCGRTRRWWCSRCVRWLPPCKPPAKVPLPFRLEVLVRDQWENATGVHAAALASPVTVRDFHSDVLAEELEGHAALDYSSHPAYILYPSSDAITARELVARHLQRDRDGGGKPDGDGFGGGGDGGDHDGPPVTVIVVDTKWNNDGAVLAHPALAGLPRLRLRCPPAASRIWRSNARAVPGCVSSIEAVYCLLREVEHERRVLLRGSAAAAAPHAAPATPAEQATEGATAAVVGGVAAEVEAHEGATGEDATGATPGGTALRQQRVESAGPEQLLLLFAVTRHLIARQTLEQESAAPFSEASKAAARLRRSQRTRRGPDS